MTSAEQEPTQTKKTVQWAFELVMPRGPMYSVAQHAPGLSPSHEECPESCADSGDSKRSGCEQSFVCQEEPSSQHLRLEPACPSAL